MYPVIYSGIFVDASVKMWVVGMILSFTHLLEVLIFIVLCMK